MQFANTDYTLVAKGGDDLLNKINVRLLVIPPLFGAKKYSDT